MRRIVFVLPFVVALTLATAPIVFADEPTPVDVALPAGTTVCAGQVTPDAAFFTIRIERTAGDIQFTDGATVSVNGFYTPTDPDIGQLTFQTDGSGEIVLPDDWSSQPEGTLSDGVEFSVWLTGLSVGTVPSQDLTWVLEETEPEPHSQEFQGSSDPFDVIDCTPTPAPTAPPAPVPTPTISPTDAVSATAGDGPGPWLALITGSVAALVLGIATVRRRRPL
jgi:MYXO-CTERM domain-containing protein